VSAGAWRLWILGSGTALPSVGRDNTCLALEVGGDSWLIDCGGSPYRRLLQAGLDPARLQGIVLTHAHADHVCGLPSLFFHLALAGRQAVLPVYGLSATLRIAERIVASFELGEYCVPCEWCAVQSGGDITVTDSDGQVGQLHVREVAHSRPALGVRVIAPNGWTAAYSGDSQPCSGLVDLARGARWLLHECTVAQPLAGHSTPEDAARTAIAAGAERVGIVHYDPWYVLPQEELRARMARAGFGGEVRILNDMDALKLAG